MGFGKETASRKECSFHPLAEEYPLMGAAELVSLADDIEVNGQRLPVVLWKGQIIDGRNRYRACRDREMPCRFVEWKGGEDDLRDVIDSLNLHRRHLTSEQQAERRAARVRRVARAHVNGASIRSIAEDERVSPGQVQRDLEAATVSGDTVDPPDGKVKGRDGRKQPARRPGGKVKAPPPPARDALGADLPDSLKDIFADTALTDAEATLAAWAEAVHAPAVMRPLAAKLSAYRFLHYDRLAGELRTAEDALSAALELVRNARPHAVCPACAGKGCDDCRHSGYVPAWLLVEMEGRTA